MRYLKRIIFTVLGLAFVTAPAIGFIYLITNQNEFNNRIGNIIGLTVGLTVIGILIAFLMCLMGALINKLFEDSKLTIFTAFFLISFQKRKRLYHSTMGEFELIIDEKDMEGSLVKQGFFSCLEIDTVNLENVNFMENINKHLDTKYKDEIAKKEERKRKKEERKRKKELVGKLMKEEGYLDTAGKRDDKITKLGI